MRPAVLILACTVMACAARGQEGLKPRGPTQPPSAELCMLEGVVVKSTDGEPVRRISVSIYGDHQGYSAITDANGHFVIQGIEPGGYYLHSGGGSYPFQTYGQARVNGRGKLLRLKPGDHLRDIAFRLSPGGVITGTISDQDGDSVVRANVQVLRAPTTGGEAEMQSSGGAQTDDLGQYRLFAIPPGRYFVVASADMSGPPRPNESTDEVNLPTFYPGTPDLTQATALEVGPGTEVSGVDIALTQAHGVRLRGRVVNEVTGKVAQGAFVSLAPHNPRIPSFLFGSFGANVQDPKGDFEIRGVPPGSYLLLSSWSDKAGSYLGHVAVDVGSADLDGITLPLAPGLKLTGRIRTEHNAPLDFARLGLWLQPTDTSMMGGASAQIGSDGTFVMENVYDGNYRLHLVGFPEEFYLKSARLGGLDVLGPGLSVSHSEPPGPFELVLTQDGGRIDGAVVNDQKPVPGALVTLVPNPPNRDRDDMYSSKTTDELGRFSLLGLPPGDYKLFALPGNQDANWRDPEFLKLYESSGSPVHVDEKKQQYLQLQLITSEQESR